MTTSMKPVTECVQLPDELYDLILAHACRDTLKVARLVNKQFNEIVQRHLFHTVFLKLNVESFTKLESLSKQTHLRSKVRELIYDPSLLPWDLNSFEEYIERGAGEGLQLDIDDGDDGLTSMFPKEEFLRKFSRLQLENHYQQYCRYLAGQKFFHRDENEVNCLSDIFRGLPRLNHVEILKWWAPEWARPFIPLRDWRNIPPIPTYVGKVAQDTLIWPRGEQFRHRRLLAVMRAAETVGLPLRSLNVGPVVPEALHRIRSSSGSNFIEQVLGKLECLQMDLVATEDGLATLSLLSELLFFANQLQSLGLSGEARWRHVSTDCVPGPLARIPWPQLKNLHLSFLSIDPPEFMRFLADHSTTLIVLELCDIDLKGSLVELLIFLSEQMNLKSLLLGGIIGNRKNEEWQIWRRQTIDEGYLALCEHNNPSLSLRQRVIDYVLHAAPFPFAKRQDVDMKEANNQEEEEARHTNPWVTAQDFSFYSYLDSP